MTILEYFMPYELVQAIGQSMLHSLWQGLIIVGLLSLAWPYLKQTSAATRYTISTAAMLLFFSIVVATFFIQYGQLSAGLSATVMDSNLECVPCASTTGALTTGQAYPLLFTPFLVIFWLIGASIMAFRLVLELVYIQRLSIHAWPVEGKWGNMIQTYASRLGIWKEVRLLESDWVSGPVTVGIIQPIILLPIGLINGLTGDQVACILAHELAHIRRYDFIVNIAQSVVEMLLFFNPTVWWISKRIREERELCCDDMAVELTGSKHQLAYTLAKLEEWRLEVPGLAMSFNSPKSKVVERIHRLIGKESKADVMTKGWMSVLLLTAFFVLAAFRPNAEVEKGWSSENLQESIQSKLILEESLAQMKNAVEALEIEGTLAEADYLARKAKDEIQRLSAVIAIRDTIPPSTEAELKKKEKALVEQMKALELSLENSPERQEMYKMMKEYEVLHKKHEEQWLKENKGLEKKMQAVEKQLIEELRIKELALKQSPEMKQLEELQRAYEQKASAIVEAIKQKGNIEEDEKLQKELNGKMQELHLSLQEKQMELQETVQAQMQEMQEIHERFSQSDEMKQLQEFREKQQIEFQKLNEVMGEDTHQRMEELQQKLKAEYMIKMEKLALELQKVSRQLEKQRRYREE